MVKAAREAGVFIRKLTHSPIWRDVMDTSREIREIPKKIVREAGIEQDLEDLRRSTQGTLSEINRSHFKELPVVKKPAEKAVNAEEPMKKGGRGMKAPQMNLTKQSMTRLLCHSGSMLRNCANGCSSHCLRWQWQPWSALVLQSRSYIC